MVMIIYHFALVKLCVCVQINIRKKQGPYLIDLYFHIFNHVILLVFFTHAFHSYGYNNNNNHHHPYLFPFLHQFLVICKTFLFFSGYCGRGVFLYHFLYVWIIFIHFCRQKIVVVIIIIMLPAFLHLFFVFVVRSWKFHSHSFCYRFWAADFLVYN